MTGPDVSVIVISYNDARRLPAAIASVQRQTLRNLEIIVVDDASSDNTADVVARLQAADPRIRYERLSANSGGCSAPRNRGIELATAPWVMFCDSDDEYERHACKNLLQAAERVDADVVCGAAYRQNPRSRTGRRWHPELHEEFRSANGLADFPELLYDTISVNKIYRASLIQEHGLRFPEGILYEDQLFTLQAMALSGRIATIPETVYLWNVAPVDSSITRRRSEFRNVESRVEVNRLIDDFLTTLDQPSVTSVKELKFLDHDLRLYLTSMCDVDDDTAAGLMDRLQSYVDSRDLSTAWQIAPMLRVAIYHLLIGDLAGVRAAMRFLTQHGAVAEAIVAGEGRQWWGCSHLVDGPDRGGRTAREWLDVTDLHLLQIPITQRSYAHTLQGSQGVTVNYVGDLDPMEAPVVQVMCGSRIVRTEVARWTSVSGSAWQWEMSRMPRVGTQEHVAIGVRAGDHTNVSPVMLPASGHLRATRVRKAMRIGWAEVSAVLAMTLGTFVPRRNEILLESHAGAACTGNVRAIGEALHLAHPSVAQVWACRDTAGDTPSYSRRVTRVSWAHAWAASRARWCIDDGTMPLDIRVRGAATVVSEGAPVRHRGLDDPSVLTSPSAMQQLRRRAGRLRMILAASQRDMEVSRSAWGFTEEVTAVGVARLDMAVPTRAELDLPENRVVVTYVPEPRARIPFDLHAWVDAFGDSTYLVAVGLDVAPDAAWAVRALTSHDEISRYISASDLVISDYSTYIGDACARGVPVVLYQPDRAVFVDRLHGLYPGLEVFGRVAADQSELHSRVTTALADLGDERIRQQPAREAFVRDLVGPVDGLAGARAAAAILRLR